MRNIRNTARRAVTISFFGFLALGLSETAHAAGTEFVYIGTHDDAILGGRLETATGKLTLSGPVGKLDRPTWLLVHPKFPTLYAVSEMGNYDSQPGAVASFAIDPITGNLTETGRTPSGGGGATYMSYDARSNALFVANFGGGQVSVVPLKPEGSLQPVTSTQTNYGSGPLPRQAGPHAHAAVLDPSGRWLLSPDLGADRVFIYRYNSKMRAISPAPTPFLQMPPGSGPRHIIFSSDGRFAYLANELSAEIRVLRWHAPRLQPLQTLPLDGPDFTGKKSAAGILLSADGRFLYVSNRGQNSLQVFAVNQQTGRLRQIQFLSCGGDVPWGFNIDPTGRWLLVANETSSTITIFAVDPRGGMLARTGEAVPSPLKPVAVEFYAR